MMHSLHVCALNVAASRKLEWSASDTIASGRAVQSSGAPLPGMWNMSVNKNPFCGFFFIIENSHYFVHEA